MSSYLLSCVTDVVGQYAQQEQIDTAKWQLRSDNDTECAVCGISSREHAEALVDRLHQVCAAECVVLDRRERLGHWCVVAFVTVVGLPLPCLPAAGQS